MNAVSKAQPRAGDENSLPDGSMIVTADQLARLGDGDVKRGRRELRLLLANEREQKVRNGPTPRPPNVRLATEADEPALLELLMIDMQENAIDYALPDAERIMEHITFATRKKGGLAGVIDGPDGKPVAVVILHPFQWWFSKQWYCFEIVMFVHPDHRKSHHADDLINWEKWASDEWTRGFGYRVPLLCGILGARRVRAKINLYRRHFAQAGIACLYPSPFEGSWR